MVEDFSSHILIGNGPHGDAHPSLGRYVPVIVVPVCTSVRHLPSRLEQTIGTLTVIADLSNT
jgi:hypothetical protein